MGAVGRRVSDPRRSPARSSGRSQAATSASVPVLVEIMVEREEDAAMGKAIDTINEFEPILDGSREMAGQIVGGVPERD